ncbi:MAG: hypothetical protein ACXU68_09945 [Croceibacterium sp.]
MATTADSYSVRRAPAKAPISSHPAFPAIVALWFSALLGIGSLVLPVELFERFVSVTGLAALVPAAAPPLGFTARIGIALIGAIAGAVTGLVLARKVAEAHAPESALREFAMESVRPCRPLSAHDELGEEGLSQAHDSAPLLGNKRRSLAMTEENRLSTYLQTAPLPGQANDGHETFSLPDAGTSQTDLPADDPLPEPLELSEFADLGGADEAADAPEIQTDPALDALRSQIHLPVEPSSLQDEPMTDRPSFDIPQALEPEPDAGDPLPFAPPSLRRGEFADFDEEEETDAADHGLDDEAPAPHLSVIEEFDANEVVDDDRPLAELGLVQLAARLGATIEKRKALVAAQPLHVVPAALAPSAAAADFEAAEPDEAARAIADYFGAAVSPEPEPAVIQPEPVADTSFAPAALDAAALYADDEDDDDALAASLSLPLKASEPHASPVDEDEFAEADDEEVDEGEYCSLLELNNPFVRQQEFVRVEEPQADSDAVEPTVEFPSAGYAQSAHSANVEPADLSTRLFDPPNNPNRSAAQLAAPAAPRDPGDAERNLRAALATLQRMSGAA